MSHKITQTAQLLCNKGSMPSSLVVTSQNFVIIENKLVATEQDKKANENIMPFGVCVITRKGCQPVPTMWTQTTQKDEINGYKILLETSTCPCAIGGSISVKQKGHQIKSEAS